MDQPSSSSSSMSFEKTKAEQRRNFIVEDITLDDMKNVELPPNPFTINLLCEVTWVANLKFEQAFKEYNRNKIIATSKTTGINSGELINPAVPQLPDQPLGQAELQLVGPPDIPAGLAQPPENIQRRIKGLGGVDTRLVLENRSVFETDIKRNHNRLSIPFGKIQDWQFLSQDEMERLNADEAFNVKLIVNRLADYEVVSTCKFGKWKMGKPSGRVNSIFVLKGGWFKDVVSRIGLVKGDILDMWSFRVNGAICFALVVHQ